MIPKDARDDDSAVPCRWFLPLGDRSIRLTSIRMGLVNGEASRVTRLPGYPVLMGLAKFGETSYPLLLERTYSGFQIGARM